MVPMQLYLETQQSHAAALERAQRSRESALERAHRRAQRSHKLEMKEAQQSRETAMLQAQKKYMEEKESKRQWQKKYMRLSDNFNIRGALEMLVISYLFDKPSLKLKRGNQEVLDYIAKNEKLFKKDLKAEFISRKMDSKGFEKARSTIYSLLSKHAHNCEDSEVIHITDDFVKTERAAIICYLRFLNRDGIVVQWNETNSKNNQIEGEQ